MVRLPGHGRGSSRRSGCRLCSEPWPSLAWRSYSGTSTLLHDPPRGTRPDEAVPDKAVIVPAFRRGTSTGRGALVSYQRKPPFRRSSWRQEVDMNRSIFGRCMLANALALVAGLAITPVALAQGSSTESTVNPDG